MVQRRVVAVEVGKWSDCGYVLTGNQQRSEELDMGDNKKKRNER